MKPPVRGDGFVMYDPLEADFRSRMAMQEYLNRELQHTPFLIPQEKINLVEVREQISHLPVSRDKSLIVIPSGQAIARSRTITDVVLKKRQEKKRRKHMTASKGKDAEKVVNTDSAWLKSPFSKWAFVSFMVLLLTLCFLGGMVYKGDCSKDSVAKAEAPKLLDQQPKKEQQSAPAPKALAKKELNYNELILVNKMGGPVTAVYRYRSDDVKTIVREVHGIRVHSKEFKVFLNGQEQEFEFKSDRGGRIVYNIEG